MFECPERFQVSKRGIRIGSFRSVSGTLGPASALRLVESCSDAFDGCLFFIVRVTWRTHCDTIHPRTHGTSTSVQRAKKPASALAQSAAAITASTGVAPGA